MSIVIITTGAISISEWIKNNHALQFLNIHDNPIGDEGIAAIGRSLDNASISKLFVWRCQITDTGAKLLAKSLINNHTIKLLNVQDNDITVDGAIAILEVAVANGVCQEVILFNEHEFDSDFDDYFTGNKYESDKSDDKYKSDDKVKEMMSILEERKRQEVGSIIT